MPPPHSTRYKCGFPGCTKRYASTDGVRKHARKSHTQWLAAVDEQSVLRDKQLSNKPSTYCIEEHDVEDGPLESFSFPGASSHANVPIVAAAVPQTLGGMLLMGGRRSPCARRSSRPRRRSPRPPPRGGRPRRARRAPRGPSAGEWRLPPNGRNPWMSCPPCAWHPPSRPHSTRPPPPQGAAPGRDRRRAGGLPHAAHDGARHPARALQRPPTAPFAPRPHAPSPHSPRPSLVPRAPRTGRAPTPFALEESSILHAKAAALAFNLEPPAKMPVYAEAR